MNRLCRFGLHNLRFALVLAGEPGGTRNTLTVAWCKRVDCSAYGEPRVVAARSLVGPSIEGSTFTIEHMPSTSAGEAAPAGTRTIGEEH